MSRKNVWVIVAMCVALWGCDTTTRPTWWKFQTNLMNRGLAQADGATGGVRFRRGYGGPANLGCPVLWSDSAHQAFNDSRIIMGIGVNGLGRIAPLQGNLVGQYSISNTITACPAAPVSGERNASIYGTTVGGDVFSVNPDLSKELWRTRLPAGNVLVTSPTPWGGLVFVGADKFFYALNDADGKIQWTHRMQGEVFYRSAPPVTLEVDNAVLASDIDGSVVKLNATDGGVVWDVKIPAIKIYGHLMLDGDFAAYVPGNDGVMYVLDPSDGHVSWQFNSGTFGQVTGAALSFDALTAYFADEGGTLFAIDVKTHKEAWRTKLPAPPTTPPTVTPNGMIYIGVGNSFQNAAVVAANRDGIQWSVGQMKGLVDFLAVGEDGSVYAVAGRELIAIK